MATIPLRYATTEIPIVVPPDAIVYRQTYPPPIASDNQPAAFGRCLASPIGCRALSDMLAQRAPRDIVIVVSDITRPVPYPAFLPILLDKLDQCGYGPENVTILVATGMHRAATGSEQRQILGDRIAGMYRIVNHEADNPAELITIKRTDGATAVEVNRHYVKAGFRIVTGLVEPHFMAGFSGGRKAVCPGLVSLDTIRRFHGHDFLADPAARNANMNGNPCHDESLSVARAVGVDFCVNVVLDGARQIAGFFCGELEQTHAEACRFVAQHACPIVSQPADVVITSCGGDPLDRTFYQCVKGLVSCVPAVKPGGMIIAAGASGEGIGSSEYAGLYATYGSDWKRFMRDIARTDRSFVKDQWQLQVHTRALAAVGMANLHFVTTGQDTATLSGLWVCPHVVSSPSHVARRIEEILASLPLSRRKTVAVIPDGPYCAPEGGLHDLETQLGGD